LKGLAPQIRWRPFAAAAFKEAADSARPILLYISAPWDYHDRLMSEITYTDPAVVRLLETEYVPVRVDTDARPDVFARYGMGAWPTTAVLISTGDPLYYLRGEEKNPSRAGGSFYPPAEFVAYFGQVADFYQKNREMVEKLSTSADEALLGKRNVARADVTQEQLEAVIGRVIDAYSTRPTRPDAADRHPDFDMIDLAFYYWQRKSDRKVLDVALHYLTDMARGGIYDRLGGGFFRYAHDTMFLVPAFEKMPSTNARALMAYLEAYELTSNGRFLVMADSTLGMVTQHMVDPTSHAFLGAIAAGSTSGDNGDYYTWTDDEMKAALTEEEYRIAASAFNITDYGEMLDIAPRRNVLFLERGPKLLAPDFKMDETKMEETLATIQKKLLATRDKRTPPPVDAASYGDWSGMMASAFFMAARTLHRDEPAKQALSALDLLLARCRNAQGLVAHVCVPKDSEIGDEAFAADQAWVAGALIDAYEQTGRDRYLNEARALLDKTVQTFRDSLSGGFSDRIADPNAAGLMSWPVRNLDVDVQMAKSLLRLGRHLGNDAYSKTARVALESWSDEFGDYKELAAGYALASQMLLNPPLEVLVVGDEGTPGLAKGRDLALSLFQSWRIVRPYGSQKGKDELKKRGVTPLEGAQVAFCIGAECSAPIAAGEPLKAALERFLSKGSATAESGKKGS
jgi:uncharacterized protein YyaL (SSP411 family)